MDSGSARVLGNLKVTRKIKVRDVEITGIATAVTPVVDNNSNQVVTTAWMMGQTATVAPLMDGAAAVGVSNKTAKEDHRHPADTTKLGRSGDTATDISFGPFKLKHNTTFNSLDIEVT